MDRNKIIYLDHAASSPLRAEVLSTLLESYKNDFANPASTHKLGKNLSKQIDNCREYFLKNLGGRGKFVFTSSATESNNMAIFGYPLNEGDEIYFSEADHASLVKPVEELERRGRVKKTIPLNDKGQIAVNELLEVIDEKSKLIVLTHVSSQTGAINPIIEIAKKIKEKNKKIFIHVDAVQGLGKIPINLKDNFIDSLSISSHKIGGPKGIAGLFIKDGIEISPLFYGGGHELGLRPSTPSTPLILSFKKAMELKEENRENALIQAQEHYLFLKSMLEKEIKEIEFPFDGDLKKSPYIMTIILPGIPSDVLLRHLESENVFVSSTSACSSKIKGENPVFTALGVPLSKHKNVLRISFCSDTCLEEYKIFGKTLSAVMENLSYLKR